MKQRRFTAVVSAFTLALVAALPAAAQLPANFTAADIGDPGAAGSTKVENGVFTIQGSGHDIWDTADDFHYVYQRVTGDGSVSARILSAEGGDATWHKAGPMIRESDAPGATNSYVSITTARGVRWQWRPVADEGCFGEEGDIYPRRLPLYLRAQRVGNETSAFVSTDGRIWRAVSAPRPLPLGESALFGLAVTSHLTGEITTATFDTVAVQPGEVSVFGADACAGDRSVLLTWRPVRNAVGYHVYRGAAEVTAEALTRITTDPITAVSYTDMGEALTNGTAQTYVIRPLFRATDGSVREGLMLALTATPGTLPAGFAACGVNEGATGGSALFNAASGEITLRAAGSDFATRPADQFFFLQQTVEGNAQITVRALTRPSGAHVLAKAGLMIRESLEATARYASIHVTSASGLRASSRGVPDDTAISAEVLDDGSLTVPIVLRMTRRGNTITSEYSTDNGQTFTESDRVEFETDLPARIHFGLAGASRDGGQLSEAKFGNLEVKKL